MHRHRLGERGQGLVEFAVIFPVFIAIMFAIIDGGLLMGRYNNINNSAKEAARLGAVGADLDQIIIRAQEQAHGGLDAPVGDCDDMNGPGNAICVEWIPRGTASPGQLGASVRVKIRFEYDALTPLPGIGDIAMTVCAIQRQEQSISPVPNVGAGESCD